MRRRVIMAGLMFFPVLLLVGQGCTDLGGSKPSPSAERSVQAPAHPGPVAASASAATRSSALPPEFPADFPIPEGAKPFAEIPPAYSQGNGKKTVRVTLFLDLEVYAVAKFYDERLPAHGWDHRFTFVEPTQVSIDFERKGTPFTEGVDFYTNGIHITPTQPGVDWGGATTLSITFVTGKE